MPLTGERAAAFVKLDGAREGYVEGHDCRWLGAEAQRVIGLHRSGIYARRVRAVSRGPREATLVGGYTGGDIRDQSGADRRTTRQWRHGRSRAAIVAERGKQRSDAGQVPIGSIRWAARAGAVHASGCCVARDNTVRHCQDAVVIHLDPVSAIAGDCAIGQRDLTSVTVVDAVVAIAGDCATSHRDLALETVNDSTTDIAGDRAPSHHDTGAFGEDAAAWSDDVVAAGRGIPGNGAIGDRQRAVVHDTAAWIVAGVARNCAVAYCQCARVRDTDTTT